MSCGGRGGLVNGGVQRLGVSATFEYRRGGAVRPTIEEFVAVRGEALLRFALMLGGDRHVAEDLVQSVLARAYPRWSRIAAMQRPETYSATATDAAHHPPALDSHFPLPVIARAARWRLPARR
jgi:hypothetical protein